MNDHLNSITPRHGATTLAVAVVCMLAACSSTPRTDAALIQARIAVSDAHADPRVKGDANVELRKADDALSRSENLLTQGAAVTAVDHQAYLADRYAHAALMHGALLSSTAEIAQQADRRNSLLLAARDRDVTRAESSAAASQRAASDANAQAAASATDLAQANERAADLQSALAALHAQQTDRGVVVTLGDVLFATGRSDLREGSGRSLDAVASFLASHPERWVRVEGFTDSTGNAAYNQGLSERRAASVAGALTQRGIGRSRVESEGYGESYPVASNATAVGRQDNRRVEVIISDADTAVLARRR